MRISLQFLILTLAFFGNSKKSKAKTEGDLIHRKDQKGRAPNMKMKKANGTSKGNHTAERELGTDYQDDYVFNLDLNLDLDLDTVDGKEKFLKKTWDELIEDVERLAEREKWGLKRQPGPLESNFTNDGSFDRWLSTAVESEQDPESEEDWNVLVNFVQGKDSANKKVSSGKTVKGKNMTKEQLRDKEFERQRFFFDPKTLILTDDMQYVCSNFNLILSLKQQVSILNVIIMGEDVLTYGRSVDGVYFLTRNREEPRSYNSYEQRIEN